MKQEDLQRRYIEFQLVDQHIKLLQQQLMLLEQQATELAQLLDNLESLKTVKPKTKAYAQLGPGVSVETMIDDPAKVVVNVGANAAVKKNLQDTQKTIQTQLEEIGKMTMQMGGELQRLRAHALALRQEIEENQQKHE